MTEAARRILNPTGRKNDRNNVRVHVDWLQVEDQAVIEAVNAYHDQQDNIEDDCVRCRQLQVPGLRGDEGTYRGRQNSPEQGETSCAIDE
jgi:hypothetical protein